MNRLKSEICRTKSQIETAQQELDGMLKDHAVPIGKPIETNRNLKELVAYLKGLECQTQYVDIETTVTVGSSGFTPCKESKSGPGINSTFGDRIDHYLKHGYRLLYFGQESRGDEKGRPWNSIIAVLGKENAAAPAGT